ncbi:MAG: hypothetical protein ACK4M9_12635 [Anaerobacillus sp.]|uniref:hypothetical protein n=1 Tax=Anaerobacillus sp. TaxID=1872506 RepID=UPI003919150C
MKRIATVFFVLFLFGCSLADRDEVVDILEAEVTSIADIYLLGTTALSTDIPSEELISKLERIKTVKEIKAGVFQGIVEVLDNNLMHSIDFYTWAKNSDSIQIIDHTAFNEHNKTDGLETGIFYFQLWNEIDSFYLSYNDLRLTAGFLNSGKLGQLPTSPITIGMSKEQLVETKGPPVVTDWYNGGTLYSYNDIAFIIDQNHNVVAISMPGFRINTILDDIPTQIGQPTDIQYSELANTVSYLYKLENYTIAFEADEESTEVLNILLYEN